MPIYTETYTEVSNRFKEWMTDRDNTGDYVTNISLDYINRARQVLSEKTFWDDLMKHSDLTVASRIATFPSDYGRTYGMYHDADGDDKADWHYYKDGKYDKGYKLIRNYDKTTGSTFTATFYRAPDYTPILLYQVSLANFVGSGTEYLFFPAELLLKQAQILYKEDADDLGGDYDRIINSFKQLLMEHKAGHQFSNPDYVMEQNDATGNLVQNEDYSLDGGGDGYNNTNNNDNSYDLG